MTLLPVLSFILVQGYRKILSVATKLIKYAYRCRVFVGDLERERERERKGRYSNACILVNPLQFTAITMYNRWYERGPKKDRRGRDMEGTRGFSNVESNPGFAALLGFLVLVLPFPLVRFFPFGPPPFLLLTLWPSSIADRPAARVKTMRRNNQVEATQIMRIRDNIVRMYSMMTGQTQEQITIVRYMNLYVYTSYMFIFSDSM